jgi:hypothetical protein
MNCFISKMTLTKEPFGSEGWTTHQSILPCAEILFYLHILKNGHGMDETFDHLVTMAIIPR